MSKKSIEYCYALIDKYSAVTDKMGKHTEKFQKTAENSFSKVIKKINLFGINVASILSAQGIMTLATKIKDGLKGIVMEASKMEDAVASFQPLMGGVDKATKLVKRLNIEAATTPFQFEGIASVTKQLLPFMNKDIEKTAKTFRMLGDTAGGKMDKLSTITKGYSKILGKGKADMESINMITEAGVPIVAELADMYGLGRDNMSAVYKMLSSGKITIKEVDKVFEKMTSEGGIFFKGMEISSQTLSGKLSTLSDNIKLTGAAVGSVFLPFIKKGTDYLGNLTSKTLIFITENKELISSKIGQYWDKFAKIFKAIQQAFTTMFKIISPELKELAKALDELFMANLDEGTSAISGISEAIKSIAVALKPVIWMVTQYIKLQNLLNKSPFGEIVSEIMKMANPLSVPINLIKKFSELMKSLKIDWNIFGESFQNVVDIILETLSDLLENPFFKIIGIIFLPFITIPALIIKNWNKVTKFFKDLGKIVDNLIDGMKKFLGLKDRSERGKFTSENIITSQDLPYGQYKIPPIKNQDLSYSKKNLPITKSQDKNVNVKSDLDITVKADKGTKVVKIKKKNLGTQKKWY